jgi:hypothetical protein
MSNCRAGAPPANVIISVSEALALQPERATSSCGHKLLTGKSHGSWAEGAIMKRSSLLIAFIFAVVCSDLLAQSKIDLQPADTILSILQRNIGQMVELRLKSGEKIGGKVEKVGIKLIQLSQLSGAEFFEVAVDAADVSAVVLRTKSK